MIFKYYSTSLIAIVSLFIASCSTVQYSIETSEHSINHWYAKARTDVEQKLNVDLKNITFRILNKSQMNKVYQQSALRYAKQHFDEKFHQSIINSSINESQGVIAIYDSHSQSILVSKPQFEDYISEIMQEGFAEGESVMPVLYHELVHAADDINYGFNRLRKQSNGADLSLSSVIEGHAQFVSRQLCHENNCKDAFDFATTLFREEESHSHKISFYGNEESNIELKYLQGEIFLSSLEQQGGIDLVEQVMIDPPLNVLQIYNPSTFPDRQRDRKAKQLQSILLTLKTDWLTEKWVKFAGNVINGESFSKNIDIRKKQIQARTQSVNASARVEYYDQTLEDLRPVQITLTQLDNEDSAKKYAQKQHNHNLLSSGSIIGSGIKINQLSTNQSSLNNQSQSTVGKRLDVSAQITTGGASDINTPLLFGISVLQTGRYIVEVQSYCSEDKHEKIVQSMIKLLNDESSSNALTML